MERIIKANTLEELAQIKENFLSECTKREQKIMVSNILGSIGNFCDAQVMFESLIVPLMGKKDGKTIINQYVKTIKENKSLKTLYAYYEGLKNNKTSESKKAYITEALSLTTPIHYNEYVKGVGDMVKIISEAFQQLGDSFILENITCDKTANSIGESLLYLASTKKNIKNLNEYISHIDNVSDNIHENAKSSINVDLSLSEIVNEMSQKVNEFNVNAIFESEDKEKTFNDTKNACLDMINTQKKLSNDADVVEKLNEMEIKLSKKNYVFETFTKDMLYMSELQEVLK